MSIDERLRTGLPVALEDVRPDVEQHLSITLERIGRRRRVRRGAVAAGLVAAAAVVVVVVVGADDTPRSLNPVERPEDPVLVLDSGEGSPSDPAPLDPGSYAIPFIGAPDDAPWATIQVPDGWSHDRLHPVNGLDLDPHLRRIELFTAAFVAPDPCHGVRKPIGPTVADLVTALSDQVTVRPGRPRPVTIDGYSGQLLQTRVPLDLDTSACGHNGSLVPLLTPSGAASTVFPGWTYRIWALDVDGHRLVILAAHGPDTTTAELDELTHMIETLTFTPPR